MYSNINSRWAFEFAHPGATITVATTNVSTFSLPGAFTSTCTLTGGAFVNETDVAKTSTAYPVIRAFISADGVVSVSVSAVVNTITIAAGAKFRGVIEVNDNNWNSDGL